MKKVLPVFYLISTLLAFSPVLVYSDNNNQLVTQLIVSDNDSVFRYIYFYNAASQKVIEVKYDQVGNDWSRKLEKEWLYADNKCVGLRERMWKNDTWQTYYSIDYNFQNEKLVSEIHQKHKNDSTILNFMKTDYYYVDTLLTLQNDSIWKDNMWTLSQSKRFMYNSIGKIDTLITVKCDSNRIVKQYRSVIVYNTNGTVDTLLLAENDSNKWINKELTKSYYKVGTKQLSSARNKVWNSKTSKWDNSQLTEYTYNADNKLVSEVYQYWKTIYWDEISKYDYVYDSNGILLSKTLSMPIYNEWRSTVAIEYSDFSNNKANLMKSVYGFWGGTAGELVNSDIAFDFNGETIIMKGKKIVVSYLPISNTDVPTVQNNNKFPLIQVYPNPSEGMFYFNTQNYAVDTWSVTDLNGRVIKQMIQQQHSGIIDLTELPKGIYILRVNAAGEQLSQKLVKK